MTAEPRTCRACRYADELELDVLRGRCGYHGGLEPGPIVDLYNAPPKSCPLRALGVDE